MRRDRPARAAARASGGSPTTSTGSPGSPTPASTRWPGTWRWSSRSRRSSNGTGRAASRCWSGCWAGSRARRRSCCWTSNGATSARRCRGTPTPTSRQGAPLAADAVTLSPYLGFGSLAPALDTAETAGRGVFVLARTSNAEGAAVQAAVADGRSVAQGIVDEAAARNRGVAPLGGVGLVVGATADHGLDLAALNGPVLAPGLGAQGAGPADIAARFRGVGGPVSAVGEPLGPRGGSGSAPPPRRRRSAARRAGRRPLTGSGAIYRRLRAPEHEICGAAGGRTGTDRRTIRVELLATCDRPTAGSGRRRAPIALAWATPTTSGHPPARRCVLSAHEVCYHPDGWTPPRTPRWHPRFPWGGGRGYVRRRPRGQAPSVAKDAPRTGCADERRRRPWPFPS